MSARPPRGRTGKDATSAGSPTVPAAPAAGDPGVRYADALEELEQILEDLENDAIDVDDLTARVKRASELIVLCRDRLTRTKLEIEQIVANLEELDAAGGRGDEAGEGDDGGQDGPG